MKVAALQMDIVWEDRKSNFEKASLFAERAASQGADFFVLPEMFATGFSMDTDITAESLNGATATFIRELAARLKIGVAGGFVLKQSGEKAQNCALAVDRNGNDLALYAKTFLFSYMGEDRRHEPGNGPVPFEFEGIPAACFICYDLRFPELFRLICHDTAAVFVIASWPSARAHHWKTLLSARAVENQLYVLGVNRTGTGDGLTFNGGTSLIDPFGTVEAALTDREGLLLGEIDPERVKTVRNTMPFLRDRRPLND